MARGLQRQPESSPNWWARIGWLVLIWAISVSGLALLAFALRLVMNAVGLTR